MHVKAELTEWMTQGLDDEVRGVLNALGNTMVGGGTSGEVADDEGQAGGGSKTGWMDRLFHLMCVLHRQDRLPAVVFNFDRNVCEKIAMHLNNLLQGAEDAAREEHSRTLSKSQKESEAKGKVQKRVRDKVLSDKKQIELLDEVADMQEAATFDNSGLHDETFHAQFSFVQEGRGSRENFERITESARKVPSFARLSIHLCVHLYACLSARVCLSA